VTSARTDTLQRDHHTLLQDVARRLLDGGWREYVTLLGLEQNRIFTPGWPGFVPTADELVDHRGNYGLKSGNHLHLDFDLHEDKHFGERAVVLAQGCAALARDICGYRAGVLRTRDADRATMALVYPLAEHHQGRRTLEFWVKPPRGDGASVKAQIEFRTGAGDSGTGLQLMIAGPHPKGGVVVPEIRRLDDSDVVDGETLERLQEEMFRQLSRHSWVEKVEWKGTKPQTRSQREATEAAAREQVERVRAEYHHEPGSAGPAGRLGSYLRGMLPGVCSEVSATVEPGRNQALFKGAAHVYGFLKGAGLEDQRGTATTELANAGLATGLDAAEVEDCLDNAWGHAQPWLPEDRPLLQSNGVHHVEGAFDERAPHPADRAWGPPTPPPGSGAVVTPKELAEERLEGLVATFRERGVAFDQARIAVVPKPVTSLWGNYLVVDEVNLLVGAGGYRKTTLVAGAMLAGAAGLKDFLGRPITEPFASVVYTAEDGDDSFHAKLHTWSRVLPGAGLALQRRIDVVPLKGTDVRLLQVERGKPYVDEAVCRAIAEDARRRVPEGRILIFLETLSRLCGGLEDNEASGVATVALERISMLAGNAAVLTAGHVGKANARSRQMDMYAGRMGSAMPDNVRSVLVLGRVPDDVQKRWQLSTEEADDPRTLVLVHAKANRTRPEEDLLLTTEDERHSGYFRPWRRAVLGLADVRAPSADPQVHAERGRREMGLRLHSLVKELTEPAPDGQPSEPVTANRLAAVPEYRNRLGRAPKNSIQEHVRLAIKDRFLTYGPRQVGKGRELLPGPEVAS
jgi:hypothetical protein